MNSRRGRKRRVAGELTTERVCALLTRSERRALSRLAAEERMTIGVLVREAINSYVADFSEQKIISCTGNSSRG